MTIQIGLQCLNDGSNASVANGKKVREVLEETEEVPQDDIDRKLFEVRE